MANIVVWPDVFERCRRPLLSARLMTVSGRVQKEGRVVHLVAEEIADRSDLLDDLLDPDAGGARIDPAGPTDEARRPVPVPGFRGTGYHPTGGGAGHAGNADPPGKARPRPRHPRDQAKVMF